jgi:hypothetical protein
MSNAALLIIIGTPVVAGLHSAACSGAAMCGYEPAMATCSAVPVDKARSQLAQRLPLDYQASNHYEFDFAPSLC